MEQKLAQVAEVYVNQECLSNGFPDTKKVNPVLYSMDNRYWNIGESIGIGFSEGKSLMK